MVLQHFFMVSVNLHMDIEALATPLQDILDLLVLMMQSIFLVSLKLQLMVLMVLQHFFMVLANLHMVIEALVMPLKDILSLLFLLVQSIFLVCLMVN